MKIVDSITALRSVTGEWRQQGFSLGLVPTMGNLHAGHLRLVEEARRRADRVIVTLFVNPTQFGPGEDFEAYPRTPQADEEKLSSAGVDLIFRPPVHEMYPGGDAAATLIDIPGATDTLCGKSRPGHFQGVLTIVCKLFNQVQPDVAIFGEKDYQQLTLIRRMVSDLDLPVTVVGVPTVREPGGLALSSRNGYLSADERLQATRIYATLQRVAAEVRRGRRDFSRIEEEQSAELSARGFQVDYLALRRASDLGHPEGDESRLVALVAARLGRARLIDNLTITLD